jgi:hypothetical protein
MDALDELRTVINAAESNKGRMDAKARQKTMEALTSIWTDPGAPDEEIFTLMDRAPLEPIADMVATTWVQMDQARRSLFLRWLPAPSTERNMRRSLLVANALIERDPATTFDVFQNVLPASGKPFSKQLRNLAGTIFFERGMVSLEGLTALQRSPTGLLRILELLVEAAVEKNVGVSAKYELATTTARILAAHNLYSDPAAVAILSEIETDVRSWHPEFLNRLRLFLSDIAPSLLDRLVLSSPKRSEAESGPSAMPNVPSVSANVEAPRPAAGNTVDIKRLFELLDGQLASARNQVLLFETVRDTVRELTGGQEIFRAQIAESQEQVRSLQDQLEKTRQALSVAHDQLNEKSARIMEIEASLQAVRTDFESERRALLERVHVNAQGVLDEFKNSLSLTLRRLLADLPGPEENIPPELAKAVLIRAHQVVESLEERGVKVSAVQKGKEAN